LIAFNCADNCSELLHKEITDGSIGTALLTFLITLLVDLVTLFKGQLVPFGWRILACIQTALAAFVTK
jgi:hypothetical protein